MKRYIDKEEFLASNIFSAYCVAISAALPLKQLKMILEMKRRNSPAFVAAKAT